ncbi:MAG: D-glucuronyl C5-epimerase domain protein, partial [Thermoleophilia bacterium]|nr:D-glucuronyl C5-epimerase domain protein [Thermoleophilia bacterium]
MPLTALRHPARIAWLAVAALCAAFVFVPAAHAKAAADPVVKAIAKAKAAKTITYPESVRYTKTWAASASGARRASTSLRKREIANVRTLTVGLAKRGQLTGPRLEGVMLSVHATTWKMLSSTRFPSNQEALRIPDELAVFKYYAGSGVQYQPFETLKFAMTFVNVPVPDFVQARQVGDRLLELAVPRGNSLAFEYYFPFGGPASPWVSSLSQAVAADFFARLALLDATTTGAATETTASPYADAAQRATRSFAMSPIQGGVSVAQGTGSWYLIYPFAPSMRVLNAHLQSLVSLSLYNRAYPSPATQLLIDKGV